MKHRHDEAGFSLIELILVILIMGLALLPLVTQQLESTIHSGDGQAASVAAFLCRERLEEVLADNASPHYGYAAITDARYPAEATIAGFPGFQRTTDVSADSTRGGLTYKAVRVTVTPTTLPAISMTTWVFP